MNQFDCAVPFHLEKSNIRGRLVRLDKMMQDINRHHGYPALVNDYLAQATALSIALVSCFKFEGLFTLQITGNSHLKLLVVDINQECHVRACARFDREKIMNLPEAQQRNIHHVFGEGHFAFTIDPEKDENRYQGVVELSGTSLSDATHHFFRQSEQLETGVVLATSDGTEENLAAAALMIQRLPIPTTVSLEEKEQLDDEWIRAMSLVASMTKGELLDRNLSNEDILYRLFWENGVRVHEAKNYISQCRCSSAKIKNMLEIFDSSAIKEMIVDDKISVTCEFCGREYSFSEEEIIKT